MPPKDKDNNTNLPSIRVGTHIAQVAETIYDKPGLTRQQIAKETNLKKYQVSTALQRIKNKGFLKKQTYKDYKKTYRYSLNKKGKKAVENIETIKAEEYE